MFLSALPNKAATYLLLALASLALGATGQRFPPLGLTTVGLGGELAGTTLQYVVNRADFRAGGQDTITMIYTIPQSSWVAIGFSSNGKMMGANAVIGFPNTREVLKYSMSSYDMSGVLPMPPAKQTLIGTSIVQENGSTTMRFTKIMEEEGEQTIVLGSNILLAAMGSGNQFFYHAKREAFGIMLEAPPLPEPEPEFEEVATEEDADKSDTESQTDSESEVVSTDKDVEEPEPEPEPAETTQSNGATATAVTC